MVAPRRLPLAVVVLVRTYGRTTTGPLCVLPANPLIRGTRQWQRETTNGTITITIDEMRLISHSPRVPVDLVIVVGVQAGVPNGTRTRNGKATGGLLVVAPRRLRLTISCSRTSLKAIVPVIHANTRVWFGFIRRHCAFYIRLSMNERRRGGCVFFLSFLAEAPVRPLDMATLAAKGRPTAKLPE